MDEPTVLRTTKIGGGFVKEDVLTYLDELNSKILSLQEENEKLKKSGSSSSNDGEIRKYKNQIDNLQEKLNASNNALRNAKKELEAAQTTIAQLQAGKPVPAGAAPAVNNSQLEAAKKEIENLKNQLKTAQKSGQPAANSKDAAELAKAKQDLARMTNDLAAKAKAVAEKTQESAAKDAKIAQLTKENAAAIAKKDEEIAKRNAELVKKDDEIKHLKEKADNPALMISDLFVQAQKTTDQLKADAQEKAEALKKEAAEKAEKVVSDAKAEAEKTVSAANATAESCIKDANIKAKTTIDEANKHADTVNEMSATVRKLLINEIESLNARFNDISTTLNGAKDIVSEARKSIDTNASQDIKKMEAPKVDMSDVKSAAEKLKTPAPAAEISKKPAVNNTVQPNNSVKPANNNLKNRGNSPVNNNNLNSRVNTPVNNVKPAPVNSQPKPKPKKSFSFDMSGMDELLKAAEAEANGSKS